MTSIKDIAKELNLAVSTVYMALNDNDRISKETRRLVQEKAREMKYVKNGAAVDLQKQKTNLILFVLNDASRSFFSYVIKSLQKATAELGYDFLISTTYGGHRNTAERFIKERRSDAVIVWTKTISDELLTEYASADFPIFVLGRKVKTDNPYVRCHLTSEVKPLVTCEYLIEKGHRRIGFVTGFAESFGTVLSLQGFRLSMKQHGLPVDESLIFDAVGSQAEDGYNVTEKQILDRLDDMDALIFSNDDIAVGAMRCFNDHNIVIPDRISVVGRHNIPASATTVPPLTTMTHSHSDTEIYTKLVKCLDSYIRMEPDLKLEKELNDYQAKDMIVERQTVRDLNKQ